MVVAGCVLVESPQDRVQQLRAVVVRPHPVAEQHVGRAVVVEAVEVASDRLVEQCVHAPERVLADVSADRRVVPRMALVMDVPELVPRAVPFAEHREEEIPVLLVEEIQRERALREHTLLHGVEQRRVLGRGPVRAGAMHEIARCVVLPVAVRDRPNGVRAVSRVELVELFGRIRVRARMTVVAAPLDELDAVELFGDACMRRVERHDAATRVREPLPHRRRIVDGAGIARLVTSATYLARAREPVPRRSGTGVDRRPVRADEESHRSKGLDARTLLEQGRQRRHHAGTGELLCEVEIDRVETEKHAARRPSHGPDASGIRLRPTRSRALLSRRAPGGSALARARSRARHRGRPRCRTGSRRR